MKKLLPEQKRQAYMKVYLTNEDKKKIASAAKKINLTQSDYIRNIVLNQPLPNIEKIKATDDLLKVNSDLARLGNLFKLAIDEGVSEEKMNILIEEITEIKAILRDKIVNL